MADVRYRLQTWCLHHPRRTTWIICEFLRFLPLHLKLRNAWWQFRHFGDYEAFDALWQTWQRSTEAK